ncbi:MAG: DUF2290 domain-containing protein [Gammaproteobacteria bacterium]|nr:DUF2290 domain-containing protein [Gammaproteobacteria bacterium]
MPTPNQVVKQINDRIHRLVRSGLADNQLTAFQRKNGRRVEIVFPNAEYISTVLKNIDYVDMYRILVRQRAYNLKMCDGALIQMTYDFSDRTLVRHRLAFLPAPHLDEFQKAPETYLDDELHGDVVARNVIPFPFRYDYDARAGRHQPLEHPLSHLTLGQYERCRMPVSAPVTPNWFVDFVVRNFYHTATRRYADGMPAGGAVFDEVILPEERRVVHVTIPGRTSRLR